MEFWKPSEELARLMAAKPKFSLADMKSEVSRLGFDQLAFAIFVLVADKMTKGESVNEGIASYTLGQQILRFYLGDDWVEANIFDDTPGSANWHKQGRSFLKSDSPDNEDQFRHRHRVIELAEGLYNLQQIPGIEHRVALLQRENLLSAFAEIQCARIMATQASQLRFVEPQGAKQCDYDAEITTPAGRILACEIKAKDGEMPLEVKAVCNTIEQARKQLPKMSPGIVWITIPEQWSTQPGAKAIVEKAIETTLNKSQRLVAVLVAFEVWESAGSGRLVHFRFTTALNTKSRFLQDDVEAAIQEFGSHKRPEWYTIDEVVKTFFPHCVQFVRKQLANEA